MFSNDALEKKKNGRKKERISLSLSLPFFHSSSPPSSLLPAVPSPLSGGTGPLSDWNLHARLTSLQAIRATSAAQTGSSPAISGEREEEEEEDGEEEEKEERRWREEESDDGDQALPPPPPTALRTKTETPAAPAIAAARNAKSPAPSSTPSRT